MLPSGITATTSIGTSCHAPLPAPCRCLPHRPACRFCAQVIPCRSTIPRASRSLSGGSGVALVEKVRPRHDLGVMLVQCPALPLGQAAPDAILDVIVERVRRAFLHHGAVTADNRSPTLRGPGTKSSSGSDALHNPFETQPRSSACTAANPSDVPPIPHIVVADEGAHMPVGY